MELLIKSKRVDPSSFLFFDKEKGPRFNEIDVTSFPTELFSQMKCEDSLTKEEKEILTKEKTLDFEDHVRIIIYYMHEEFMKCIKYVYILNFISFMNFYVIKWIFNIYK